MQEENLQEAKLRKYILDEVSKAFGYSDSGLARILIGAIFFYPAYRSASLAAEVEHYIEHGDLQSAAVKLLQHFADTVTVSGDENIPPSGPLLVACNHPGAFDSAVMGAILPRKDLKILVSGVPFLYNLPNLAQFLVYAPGDTYDRMKALRLIMRHLKTGGAILSFASGKVDPDPEVLPGARDALSKWSSSLEIILRRVPETRLLPAIISGVLSRTAMRIPLIRIEKEAWKQRRLAEYFQVAGQLLFPKRFRFRPSVSFGQPMSLSDIESTYTEVTKYENNGSPSRAMLAIRENAMQLLAQHEENLL